MGRKEKIRTLSFSALIRKEGINPYLDPPLGTGKELLASRSLGVGRGREGGVIPVEVHLDGQPFKANLMPLGPQRTQAAPGKHQGKRVRVILKLDLKPRVEPMNPGLASELKKDPKARAVFEDLSPSHQKELKRYLNHLKSPEALQRNVDKVMVYLRKSQARWFGKKKPER